MLIFAFFLAIAACFFQSIFFLPFAILPFAPWLSLVSFSCNRLKALWLSALTGAFLDLISDDPMGVHALNYALSVALLFHYRKYFLLGNPLHLSLFTSLVSFTSTLLQFFLLFLFDRRIPFSGKWAFGDLIGMPIADGIYALVWFAAPLALFAKGRHLWGLFWLRHRNLSPPSP